jgi:hypothetical protein
MIDSRTYTIPRLGGNLPLSDEEMAKFVAIVSALITEEKERTIVTMGCDPCVFGQHGNCWAKSQRDNGWFCCCGNQL